MNKKLIILVLLLLLINIKFAFPNENETVNYTNITLDDFNVTLDTDNDLEENNDSYEEDIQKQFNNISENVYETNNIQESVINFILPEPKSSYSKEDYVKLNSNICRNRKCVTEYELSYYQENTIDDSSEDYPTIIWKDFALPKNFDISILRKIERIDPIYSMECNPTYKDLGNGTQVIEDANCKSIYLGTKTTIDYVPVENIENGIYIIKISGELYPGQTVDNIINYMDYSYPEYAIWSDNEWIIYDYWEFKNSTKINIALGYNGTIELKANYSSDFIIERQLLYNITFNKDIDGTTDYYATDIKDDGNYIWGFFYGGNHQAILEPFYYDGGNASYNNDRCHLTAQTDEYGSYSFQSGDFIKRENTDDIFIANSYTSSGDIYLINATNCSAYDNLNINGAYLDVVANDSTIFMMKYQSPIINVYNYTINSTNTFVNFSSFSIGSSSGKIDLIGIDEDGNIWITNNSKYGDSDERVIYIFDQNGNIINSTKKINGTFYGYDNDLTNTGSRLSMLHNANFTSWARDQRSNETIFLYKLPYLSKGEFITQWDAGNIATNWKNNFTNCSIPSGTLIEQYWQTSNDNSTWSSWTNDFSSLSNSRYLRYKLNLSTTDVEKTPVCYMINFTYDNTSNNPVNPIMSVENNSFWNFLGLFEGPETVEDFSGEINSALETCEEDEDGNCLIALNFSSESAGILEIYDLIINYSISDSINPNIHNVSVNHTVTPSYNLIIKANVTDNINLTSVNATLNNASAELLYNLTSDTWDGNLTAPSSPGQYTLKVSAIDWMNLTSYNDTVINISSSSADLKTFSTNITTAIYPIENDNITINATIYNYGDIDANSFKVSLLIDNVTNFTNDLSVNANSDSITVFNWTAIQGNHTITISIDTSGDIAEYDETNNNASILLYSYDGYTPQINSVVADSVVEDSPIIIKANVTDNIEVSNVIATIDSQDLDLEYNSTSGYYENSIILSKGNYELKITAEDINGLVSSKNMNVDIYDSQQDLIILSNGITYREIPISTGKDNIIDVNITNLGDNASGEFLVNFKIDNITQSNNSHSVDASSTNTTTFIWYGQIGNHTLTVDIDILNNVSESNETNNNATRFISVLSLNTPVVENIIFTNPTYEYANLPLKANVTSETSLSQVNATYNDNEIELEYNSTSGLYEGETEASSSGEYYINITAWDINGLKSSRSKPLTINSASPDLTMSYLDLLLSPNNITEPNELIINVTVHNEGGEDSTEFKVNITIGSHSDTNDLTVNKASSNTTTFAWTSVYGNYTLFIALDSANEISESNETNNNITRQIFVLDTTGPNAPELSATPSTWSSTTTPQISWGALSDTNGIGRYEYRIDYGDWISNELNTDFNTPVLENGIHDIYVRGVDSPGNLGSIGNVSVYVDTQVPNTPVIREWHCGNNWTQHDTAYLTWVDSGDEGSGITNYFVQVDEEETNIGYNLSYHTNNLTTGAHTLKVKASDALNQNSSWSNEITVYIDTTLPSAPDVSSPTHPDNNTWYDENIPEFVLSSPSDDSGIYGYYYLVDKNESSSPNIYSSFTRDNDINISLISTSSVSNTSTLEGLGEGEWYFHISSMDNAGNIGEQTYTYLFRINSVYVNISDKEGILNETNAADVGYNITFNVSANFYKDYSINMFNNSLTSENLTFSSNQNITRYLEIQKGAEVGYGSIILRATGENNNSLWLEVGDEDGSYEWNVTDEFVINMTSDLSDAINDYLDGCSEMENGNCTVPFKFHSVNATSIEYSNIQIYYQISDVSSVLLVIWKTIAGTGIKLWQGLLTLIDGIWTADINVNDSFSPSNNFTIYVNDSSNNTMIYEGSFNVNSRLQIWLNQYEFERDDMDDVYVYANYTTSNGVPIEDSNMTAEISYPNGTTKQLALSESDPGIYSNNFKISAEDWSGYTYINVTAYETNLTASTAYLLKPDWWNSSWKYRIPLMISLDENRTNALTETSIDFGYYLDLNNESYTSIDQNSVRVIDHEEDSKLDKNDDFIDADESEILFRMNGSFYNPQRKTYWVYFDIIDNGNKDPEQAFFEGAWKANEFYVYTNDFVDLFAYEDNTEVNIVNVTDMSTLSTVSMDEGENYTYPVSAGFDNTIIYINSTSPISVLSRDINAINQSGTEDEIYSLKGDKYYTLVPYNLWISSYTDNNNITIKDLSDGDDDITLLLNEGEYYNYSGFDGDVVFINATDDVTIVAGYEDDNVITSVFGEENKLFYTPVFGTLFIIGMYNDTYVNVTDYNGGEGNLSVTINRRDVIEDDFGVNITLGNGPEFDWGKIESTKPVLVIVQAAGVNNNDGLGQLFIPDTITGAVGRKYVTFGPRISSSNPFNWSHDIIATKDNTNISISGDVLNNIMLNRGQRYRYNLTYNQTVYISSTERIVVSSVYGRVESIDTEGFTAFAGKEYSFEENYIGNLDIYSSSESNLTINNLILNSSDGKNTTNSNLTASWNINANVKNITNWYLNNNSIALLNMPFEGGSSDTYTKDYSGYNNYGNVSGATYNSTGGYDGFGAYQFNGDNKNYINTTLETSIGRNHTYGGWIKWNSIANDGSTYDVPMQQADSGDHGFELFSYSVDNTVRCWAGTTNTDGYPISIDTWYHVMCWHNDTKMCLYINGNEESCISSTSEGTNEKFVIGGGVQQNSYWFNGSIDDVRVYNRSLSKEQIKFLFENKSHILSSSETEPDDVWNIEITANDGTSDSESVSSNYLKIKSKPIISNLILNASDNPNNSTNANLTAYWDLTDSDGDNIKNISVLYLNNQSIQLLNLPFEGGSNSTYTKDYSHLNNYGTVMNAVWNQHGGFDGFGAYEFDGDDDYINFGDNDNFKIKNKTVVMWIKPENYTSVEALLAGGTGNWFVVLQTDNRLSVSYQNSSNTQKLLYSDNDAITIEKWNHIAVSWEVNGNEVNTTLYVNGQIEKSFYNTDGYGDNFAALWRLGIYNTIFDYNGTIDDFGLYNKTLSSEQIKFIFENRTDLLSSQETEIGDVWNINVTANDGYEDSISQLSNPIIIL